MIRDGSLIGAWCLTCCLAALGGCGGGHKDSEYRTTGLMMEPIEVKLGRCLVGEKTPFAADLVNYGTEPIEISGMRASCGCINVQINGRVCEPNRRLTISGEIRSDSKVGQFRHIVTIREATSEKEHNLVVTGILDTRIKLSPEVVVLSPSPARGTSGDCVVAVHNTSDQSVRLQQIVGLPDGVQARIETPELASGETGRIVFRAPSTLLMEEDHQATLSSSLAPENMIPFPVRVRPIEGIKLVPPAIRLGVVKKSYLLKQKSFKIRLIGSGLNLVEVANVTVPAFLEGQASRSEDSIDIECRYVDRFPGLNLSGEIIVVVRVTLPQSGVKEDRVIKIPISGVLSDE
jgi:hypothetical protein